MRALGSNLVLRFNEDEDPMIAIDRTAEEILARDQREAQAYHNHPTVVACRREGIEEDQNVRMLQAELIRFLIRQIKRKNKKIVALNQTIADNQHQL